MTSTEDFPSSHGCQPDEAHVQWETVQPGLLSTVEKRVAWWPVGWWE